MRRVWLGASAAVLAMTAATTAQAQAQAQAQAPVVLPSTRAQTSQTATEDPNLIIVTGQRDRENVTSDHTALGVLGDTKLLDAPFSVQSYGEALIRNSQALTLIDVIGRDASVTNTNAQTGAPRGDYAAIRGFDVDNTVSLGINGIYGLVGNGATSLFYVERVDLFKGPTAFLTGAPSSVGGTIDYTTKRAPAQDVSRFGISYISDSILGGEADISRRRASGDLGVRLSGTYREGGSVYGSGKTRIASAAIGADAKLGDFSFSADLIYNASRISDYQLYTFFGPTYPITTGLPRTISGRNPIALPYMAQFYNNVIGLVSGSWDFAKDWRITTSYGRGYEHTGYNGYCYFQLHDRAGNGSCVVNGLDHTPIVRQSAEVKLAGSAQLGFTTHKLVAGASYITSRSRDAFTEYGDVSFNIYDDARPPRPDTPAFTSYGDAPLRQRSLFKSLYVGDTISILEGRVSFTAGLRYADIAAKSYEGDIRGQETLSARSNADKASPAFALATKPVEWLTLYGNIVQALEPGQTAGPGTSNEGEAFPPLVSRQIEVGAKAQLGRLLATAAFFRIRKPSYILVAGGSSLPTLTQDGRQQNQGIELSLSGAATNRLRVIVSGSYIDAKFTRTEGGAFEGNRVPEVPRHTERGYIEWDTSFLQNLTLIGGLNHVGPAPFDRANTFDVPSYTLVEAGARYVFDVARVPLAARISVQNLTGEKYWLSSFDGGFNAGSSRVVSLSLNIYL